MKSLIIGPNAMRRAKLQETITGIAPNLDTDINLGGLDPSDGNRLHHIGADLYVPTNMQAFNIRVNESMMPLTIAAIEVNYDYKADDFIVSQLFVNNVMFGKTSSVDIDGIVLRQIPVEKYKRMVISSWILRDGGYNELENTRRWMSWAYQVQGGRFTRSSRRGANVIDLLYTARIYVAARYGDGDAHETVAKLMGISKATAGRWINKAREAGYIDHIGDNNHFGESADKTEIID